ncbi:MAG: hypothetical protein ACRDTA_04990 [Pseudonocardiaceae bacterium]
MSPWRFSAESAVPRLAMVKRFIVDEFSSVAHDCNVSGRQLVAHTVADAEADAARQQSWVRPEQAQLVGVGEQSSHTVADEVGGGLVAGQLEPS